VVQGSIHRNKKIPAAHSAYNPTINKTAPTKTLRGHVRFRFIPYQSRTPNQPYVVAHALVRNVN
jgi:hypothetical protein